MMKQTWSCLQMAMIFLNQPQPQGPALHKDVLNPCVGAMELRSEWLCQKQRQKQKQRRRQRPSRVHHQSLQQSDQDTACFPFLLTYTRKHRWVVQNVPTMNELGVRDAVHSRGWC